MQTFLLRRTKGLANDQMRIMCAVIATVLLIISMINNGDKPQIKFNMHSRHQKAVQAYCELTEDAYNDKGITLHPSEVGNDILLETSIANEQMNEMLKERTNFAQMIKQSLVEQRRCVQEEIALKEQLESIVCDPSDITKISNMTKEQIAVVVDGTWLEGKEDILYLTEQQEQINVFFIYSVATLESEFGTSPRAVDRDNYYGLETMADYGSFENNTLYFADMMNRLYVNNDNIGSDINDIGPVYCPPNPKWAGTVSEIMNQQYKKICQLTVA